MQDIHIFGFWDGETPPPPQTTNTYRNTQKKNARPSQGFSLDPIAFGPVFPPHYFSIEYIYYAIRCFCEYCIYV